MRKSMFFSFMLSVPISFACTTFATFNGADDSLLMAKNRDNRADRQVIEVVVEKGKLRYLALSRQDVPDFVSAGINEHNLAVFNEVTVEYSAQSIGGIADDFSKDILQNYSRAKEVIPDLAKLVAKFPDPVFYQVADAKQILAIEVAPNHKFSYKLIDRGVFVHTNNYLEAGLIKNYPYTATENARLQDSITRLNRATYLLSAESAATLASMQYIALDHTAGNNNSILRLGGNDPHSVKSLAFFAIQIDKSGKNPSQLQANLYNVGEKYVYSLDGEFWNKYTKGATTLPASAK